MSKKRLIAFGFLLFVGFALMLNMPGNPVAGEKPKGMRVTGMNLYTLSGDSVDMVTDTSAAMAYFTAAGNYSSITLRYRIGLYSLDAVGIDTTDDSLRIQVYTGSNSSYFNDTNIYSLTIPIVDSAVQTYIVKLTDSSKCCLENVYMKIIGILDDTLAGAYITNDSDDVIYQLYYEWYGKP